MGYVWLFLYILALLKILPQSYCSPKVSFKYEGEGIVEGRDFFVGPCLVATTGEKPDNNQEKTCPDPEVGFFLFTDAAKADGTGHPIQLNSTGTNILQMDGFNPNNPTKIIVHGYNSDMQLDALIDARREYLLRSNGNKVNVIAVDWSRLAAGPCYPLAVGNVPHVGKCVAQMVQRLREVHAEDIHVIGFSLGAHVPAYTANELEDLGEPKLPRISGLDPAMPLFITVDRRHKLDSSDANFVDVMHTNAFIQGKIEPSGHIDFYMNGGVNQPGCWQKKNPFGCAHHRAAAYFAESINSDIGFWGWPCPGFIAYLLGLCPPRFPAVKAGEPADGQYKGFFIVKTKSSKPFAEGPFQVQPQFVLSVR
ncbi:hypothetical protein QAD02_000936 [Eretmocerus hayati]|uniref:Uncharacterized protein n=1 Tax=Eretmocerus hayati TaxID=131215 RepID=A0ACC2NET4_9HYME|nr:hypothetical protein QAD02_000936 [Eretmocerus hayati]